MNSLGEKNYHIKRINDVSIDGVHNAIVRLDEYGDDIIFRGRSEILIVKDNKVLLCKEGNDYKLPGGTWDSIKENHGLAAAREAQEEVRMNVSNIRYITDYAIVYSEPLPWVMKNVPEYLQWRGYYTEVYIGEYKSMYTGYVQKVDRDIKMQKNARFYDINDVYKTLKPEHKLAIDYYLNGLL